MGDGRYKGMTSQMLCSHIHQAASSLVVRLFVTCMDPFLKSNLDDYPEA